MCPDLISFFCLSFALQENGESDEDMAEGGDVDPRTDATAAGPSTLPVSEMRAGRCFGTFLGLFELNLNS